jgi:Protein of unknown function (DUF3311)
VPVSAGTRRPPTITARRVIAGLCVAAPFIALVWVPSFASLGPHLWSIPFFYWYQMLWVPLAGVLTLIAYVLLRGEGKTSR